MRTIVITPSAPIVTPADARAQLRLDADTDTALLTEMIAAATANIDGPAGWLGRAIGAQTLEAQLDGFYDCGRAEIPLSYPPLIEVVSVKYDDASGTEQTVAPASYTILGGHGIYPKPGFYWPDAEAVRVRYRAGYDGQPVADGGTGPVPAPIRHAILMMVARLYASRGEDQAANLMEDRTVERLLAPYRVF